MKFKILIFVILSIVYLSTLNKGLNCEDSGELATSVFSIGIPHPPGYPLYVITAKLFTFIIPSNSIIYKTNLFSAFFAILCCITLYEIILFLTSQNILSFILAILFGLSKTFWSQSIITEVYTFNLFLVSLFILYSLKTLKEIKYVKFLSFLTGLLIVSHYSNFLILLPVWLIIFFKYKRRAITGKYLIYILLPLILYFSLLIRSKANPLIDWGNPENFENFITHILRLSFGSMVSKAPRSLTNFIEQLKMFGKIFLIQFSEIAGIIAIIFFLTGFNKLPKNLKILFLILLLATSFGVIIILNFKTDEESFWTNIVFFLQFFLIFTIIAGYGLSCFKKFGIIISFFMVFICFTSNYKYNNMSNRNFTIQYNKNLLKSAKYKSTVFVAKDFVTFPILYLNRVEYLRPDIKFYDWFGNVFENIFNIKGFHLLPEFKRDEIRESISDKIRDKNRFETYYSFQRSTIDNMKCLGLIYTFNKEHPDFDINYYEFDNVKESEIKYLDFFTKNMISVYYFHLGYYYLQKGDERLKEYYFNYSNKFGGSKGKHYYNLAINELKQGREDRAIFYLNQAINEEPELDRGYFVLGNLYFNKGLYSEAEKMYLKAIAINRLNGPAYNNLGNLYLKIGKKDEAIEIFKAGLFTGYSKLFNNLAIIFASEKDFKLAEYYLKEGIKKSPDDIELYLNLSVVLSRMDNWQESRLWLEKALELEPENEKVLLNLGIVYIKLNNFKKAFELLQKGANKYPQNKEFMKYLKIIKDI